MAIHTVALHLPDAFGLVPSTGRLIYQKYDTPENSGVWSSLDPGDEPIRIVPFTSNADAAHGFFEHDGLAYFSTTESYTLTRFWRSDGTASGTVEFATASSNFFSFLPWPALPEGRFVRGRDGQGPPNELRFLTWTGEYRFLGNFGQTYFNDPYAPLLNGRIYFIHESADEVWQTDGTAAGTLRAFDYPQTPNFSRALWGVGDRIFFPSTEASTGSELWSHNPLNSVTALHADICPGPCGSGAWVEPTPLGGLVLASPTLPPTERLYWLRTSGTLLGPVPFGSVDQVFESVEPLGVVAGELLLSRQLQGGQAPQLWSLDPDNAVAAQLTEFGVRTVRVAPHQTSLALDSIIFWRDTPALGSEPWRIRLASPCAPSPDNLCFDGSRFRLTARWRDFQGHEGEASAVQLTPESGYLWFFDPERVEIAVKIVDGVTVNDHFWTYYGSLTNVEFWITIEDTSTGFIREYHNSVGQFGSFGDILSLPSGYPGSATSQLAAPSASMVQPFGVSLGTCAPSATRVCLLGGRFAIEADWTDFEGQSGAALAETLTSDTGYLWFFDPDVVEIVVKLVDGGGLNGHFWVYFGSLSNVEFTIYVTDTLTGETKPYRNPLGAFGSFGDIEAFPAP